MATNFNENSIVSSGGFKPSSKDTPLDIRTRVETEQDIYEIPNPYIGMIVYVKDTGKRFEILTLKEVDMGLTTKNVVGTYKQFTVDLEEYAKIEDVPTKVSELENDKGYLVNQDISGKADVEDIPTKVSELENDRGYATERFVDSKIETINNTVNSNTNTINSKINTINSNINTINSNINTINTEIDNINTDLVGVPESIEGSSISVVSKDGYLKDIEIIGNTIQNQDNLADIRSVGDKLENQELYEIPVLSANKNLFSYDFYDYSSYSQLDNAYVLKEIKLPVGIITISNKKIKEQTSDMGNLVMQFWDNTTYSTSTRKPMINSGWVASSQNIITIEEGKKYYIAINITGNTLNKETILEKVKDMYEIQIEVGNTATPYEPYQEDKLTILSPTPLEKVGDVADRIICKDGVWGVEKNIETLILNGGENWRLQSVNEKNIGNFETQVEGISYTNYISSIPKQTTVISETDSTGIYINYEQYLFVRLENITTIAGCIEYLKNQNVIIKYATAQPIFIPLPHDQQIKLRTFASKTNISFGCEIEPTLKASVPKSIGASVSSHSEQIDNLSKELDRVKKLEESTVSTVTTESDFTTVTETSNGYFEDVKLDGRTLVNLFGVKTVDSSKNIISVGLIQNLKANTDYTLIFDTTSCATSTTRACFIFNLESGNTHYLQSVGNWEPSVKLGKYIYKLNFKDNVKSVNLWWNGVDGTVIYDNIILLEGDHTQNPPEYFEGIKSIGQDVEDITIATTNAPMFFGKGGKK